MPMVEPFIRWAGGKTCLVKSLRQIIGELQYKNYYEPFLGGAAVFFSIEHSRHCYLSDMNEELINTYIAVRDNPLRVIDCLQSYSNTSEDYYRVRSHQPEGLVEQAARFIFLNQTSFNGLYRVNKHGQYNVPYG